jgi:hypothetical protein
MRAEINKGKAEANVWRADADHVTTDGPRPAAPPALACSLHGHSALPPHTLTMYGNDDEVFDSVTWESPAPPAEGGLDAGVGAGGPSGAVPPAGPGFRQSASDDDGRDPNAPRWEGYLRTAVRDPTKEMAESKDAYVSYLVVAEVRIVFRIAARPVLGVHS